MSDTTNWLFPNTTIGTILRRRPRAMAVFEGSGIDPWKVLNLGLGEVLGSRGLSMNEFVRALRDLPRPSGSTAWKALPVYYLLDFLVEEHRFFLDVAMPAIGRALSDDAGTDSESLQWLDLMSSEWPAFSAAFAVHIREEEESLFERVLRYHSCLLPGGPDPDLEGGSVRVYGAVRLLAHGHRDLELTRTFLEKVAPILPGESSALSALEVRVRPLLEEFQERLIAHANLEAEVLFPMAMAMEKALYDRLIQGEGRHALAPLTSRETVGFRG